MFSPRFLLFWLHLLSGAMTELNAHFNRRSIQANLRSIVARPAPDPFSTV